MNKRVMIISAILIFGLMAGLALASATTQDAAKSSSMNNESKKAPAQAGSALSSSDQKFVMEAAHGGMLEVELGRMAVDKASNADVKQFGQRMVDDHSKAGDELMQLASQKGITLSSDDHKGMAKGQAVKDKLSKLSGADFDREYMDMMVKDHVKDVKEFE